MASGNVNEQTALLLQVQSDCTGTSVSTGNTLIHLTLISVDANRCRVDPNGCNNHAAWKSFSLDSDKAELGKSYVCGSCKHVLQSVPSKYEYDLERQLQIQRIQQQIELEDLQHMQRMKHLRTLLLN